jgi:hypothetical protein
MHQPDDDNADLVLLGGIESVRTGSQGDRGDPNLGLTLLRAGGQRKGD